MKTNPLLLATVDATEETKAGKQISEEEKRRKAFSSFEAYAEYMKLDQLYAKPIEQWNPTDFVKFYYCGIAKYSVTGPKSMPIWAKDARIMQVYIKKYGCDNLNQILLTLCKRKDEVEKLCRREITLSMSILAIPWIMEEVVKLTFAKPSETPVPESPIEKIQANRAAELKAAEVRTKLNLGSKQV